MADHPWRGSHRDELDVRHAESARVVALEAQLREASHDLLDARAMLRATTEERDAAERIAVALADVAQALDDLATDYREGRMQPTSDELALAWARQNLPDGWSEALDEMRKRRGSGDV